MNGKERILSTINLEDPDRIPIDFGSTTATSIALKSYIKLAKFLKIKIPRIDLMMKNFQLAAVHENVLKRFDIDTRGIYGQSPYVNREVLIDKNTYISEWGIKYRMPKNGLYYDMIENPLANSKIEDLEDLKFPDPYDKGRIEGVEEKAKKLYKQGEYAILGDMVETGIFEPCWYLRGFEKFMLDLAMNKEFAKY